LACIGARWSSPSCAATRNGTPSISACPRHRSLRSALKSKSDSKSKADPPAELCAPPSRPAWLGAPVAARVGSPGIMVRWMSPLSERRHEDPVPPGCRAAAVPADRRRRGNRACRRAAPADPVDAHRRVGRALAGPHQRPADASLPCRLYRPAARAARPLPELRIGALHLRARRSGARLLREEDAVEFRNAEWNREAGRPFIEHQIEIVNFQVALQRAVVHRSDLRLIAAEEMIRSLTAAGANRSRAVRFADQAIAS